MEPNEPVRITPVVLDEWCPALEDIFDGVLRTRKSGPARTAMSAVTNLDICPWDVPLPTSIELQRRTLDVRHFLLLDRPIPALILVHEELGAHELQVHVLLRLLRRPIVPETLVLLQPERIEAFLVDLIVLFVGGFS